MESEMASNELANPITLGLYGFALAVILLSIHNLGFFGMDPTIMAAAIFMGGFAQVIAGLMEFKRNSMFTGTVFTLLGLFWIAFGTLQAGALGTPNHTSLSTFFLIFTILVVCMTFATLKSPKSFTITFVLIVLTLVFLTSGAFLEMEILTRIGGAVGIVTGAAAVYIASAEMYAEQYKKQILPL
jgi:succinate-acetate transporter protein